MFEIANWSYRSDNGECDSGKNGDNRQGTQNRQQL